MEMNRSNDTICHEEFHYTFDKMIKYYKCRKRDIKLNRRIHVKNEIIDVLTITEVIINKSLIALKVSVIFSVPVLENNSTILKALKVLTCLYTVAYVKLIYDVGDYQTFDLNNFFIFIVVCRYTKLIIF